MIDSIKLLTLLVLFVACKSHEIVNAQTEDNNTYSNPIINKSLPDPTIIKAGDGYFYLYATENIRNTPIHRSKDLVNWEFVGGNSPSLDAEKPVFLLKREKIYFCFDDSASFVFIIIC